MVKIRKHLVSKTLASRVTYDGKNTLKYIVIHETDNTSRGANADAHARLQAGGNSRQASWHYQVDDKEIVQSFEDTAQCWHAGNMAYNKSSIGIEICVNDGGDFKKALDNTVELVKSLMKTYNIPIENVVQHNKASGKNCPRNLRSGAKGVKWAEFIAMVGDKSTPNTNTSSGSKTPTTPSKTTNTPKPNPSAPKGNLKTGSIVVYLQSIREPYSFAHRKKLAQKHGITNYTGTATQNTRLLSILRGATTSKPSTSINAKPTTITSGTRVKLKNTASTYSRTSTAIPQRYKNKIYTVQQVGKNDVLLKELYSWVRKTDVE